jgi:hypothetical protein
MKSAAKLIAALMAIVGVIWILQGVGILPGSFMSGDPTWAVIGAAVLIVSGAVFYFTNRQQASSS